MLLALLYACDPGAVEIDDTDHTGKDSGGSEPQPPGLALTVPGGFDPILGGPVTVEATSGAGAVSLDLLAPDGGTVVSGSGSLTWDGKDGAGGWAAPGVYSVQATVTDPDTSLSTTASAELGLVRVGVATVYADPESTGGRVPLYWHKSRELQDGVDAIGSIANLDDGTTLTSFPAVSTNLETVEADAAQPVAWPYDSRPTLTLVPGASIAMPYSGLDLVDVNVAMTGWDVLSGNPLADGVPVVLQKQTGLADGPGVVEGDLTVQFLVGPSVIGSQAIPWRAYALYGEPTWEASGPQYTSWVAAVDPALRGIQGVAPDQSAVLDALVEWIYFESGLSYDTQYGASAYTVYMNQYLDAEFNFSGFLARSRGTIVNCTDCASILLTYANMLGAQLNYTIIERNFQLNQIKAIGGTEFTNCPFGAWGCGFSYHAVTTNDEGETIWDATLALDGDDDPGSLPSEELLVQTIDGEEYLERLVMSGAAHYQYNDQGTIK